MSYNKAYDRIIDWVYHYKYARHYASDAMMYAAAYMIRELTNNIDTIVYYDRQMSNPDIDFNTVYHSYRSMLFCDFMQMYNQNPEEFSKCFNKAGNDVNYQITYIAERFRYIMSGIHHTIR